MIKFYFAILIFISIKAIGQTNYKLDQKNGFKTYKFGDPQKKYIKNIIKKVYNNRDDIFEYKPVEFNSIYNWQFAKMYMIFYDNKLGQIVFYWPDNDILYMDILSKLEIVYGKSLDKYGVNDSYGVGNDLISYNHWKGEFVVMSLRRYRTYSDIGCPNCKIALILTNENITKEHLEKEF